MSRMKAVTLAELRVAPDDDREKLAEQVAEAMRRNGREPEVGLLLRLPAGTLREILTLHTRPFYAA